MAQLPRTSWGCKPGLDGRGRPVELALRFHEMTNVRELLTPIPPPILYHYTTPAGLLGIVGNQEIWASHTQYLNRRREFAHTVDTLSA